MSCHDARLQTFAVRNILIACKTTGLRLDTARTPSTMCAATTAMKQAPMICTSSMSRRRSIVRLKDTDTWQRGSLPSASARRKHAVSGPGSASAED